MQYSQEVMKTNIKAALVVAGILSVFPALHFIERNSEAKKMQRVPQEIVWVEQAQRKVKEYFADDITPIKTKKEMRQFLSEEVAHPEYWVLYDICRHPSDNRMLHDSTYLTTQKGADIEFGLFELRWDASNKKDEVLKYLKEYKSYLQSDEYRDFFKPLDGKERIGRFIYAALTD